MYRLEPDEFSLDELRLMKIQNLLEQVTDILNRKARGDLTNERASKEGIEALINYVGEDISNFFLRLEEGPQSELVSKFEELYKKIGIEPEHKKDGLDLEYRGVLRHEDGNFFVCADDFSDLSLRWIDILMLPVNKKIKTQMETQIVGALIHALINLGSNRHQAEHFVSKWLGKSYPSVKKKYVEWKNEFDGISDDEFLYTQMASVIKFVEHEKRPIPDVFPQAIKAYDRICKISAKSKSFNESIENGEFEED